MDHTVRVQEREALGELREHGADAREVDDGQRAREDPA